MNSLRARAIEVLAQHHEAKGEESVAIALRKDGPVGIVLRTAVEAAEVGILSERNLITAAIRRVASVQSNSLNKGAFNKMADDLDEGFHVPE